MASISVVKQEGDIIISEYLADIILTDLDIQASLRYQNITDMDGDNFIYTFNTNARPINFQITLLRSSELVIDAGGNQSKIELYEMANSRDGLIDFFDRRFKANKFSLGKTYITVITDSGMLFDIIPNTFSLSENSMSPNAITATISAYLISWTNSNKI